MRNRWGPGTIAALAALASIAFAAPAAAHPNGQSGPPPPSAPGARGAVQLRGCFLTVVLVPRPASALQPLFRRPLDLTRTFYGPDPLLSIWGVRCDEGTVDGEEVRSLVFSLVGVPVDLTDPQALPLANNFAHVLVRADTTSPVVAKALRRAKLPTDVIPGARYGHLGSGVVPSTGTLVVPGLYSIRVTASDVDPTNPHDHVNRFEYRGRGRRVGTLELSIADAFDRFCFTAGGNCTATVAAPAGSLLACVLGGTSAPVRIGFDHAKIDRIDLRLGKDILEEWKPRALSRGNGKPPRGGCEAASP
jgi:hypothetical protein